MTAAIPAELSTALVQTFAARHPEDAAAALEALPANEMVGVLESLPPEQGATLVGRLTADGGARAFERMSESPLREILLRLDPAWGAAVVARLAEAERKRVLAAADPRTARELRELISYPEDSAGRLMDPVVMSLREETTVEEALTRLRQQRGRRIHNVFLVDAEGKLLGRVRLQELATAPPEEQLVAIAERGEGGVAAMATREEVVEELTRRRRTALPVVDADNRLIGVIRYDALVTAVQDEAGADMQTMVGASREERALSKVSFAVRKRLPWLHINLLTAFLAAAVVGIFEETIAQFTALAVLLPVVAGQSGNTGAQALAVTMRGLAIREIRPRQWPRVTSKEVRVAIINGIAVAITTSVGVLVWSGSAGLALVIGSSMIISMAAAGLSGAIIPVALTSLGQDPAQASSIILTTVTDVVGFFSFLGIATVLAEML